MDKFIKVFGKAVVYFGGLLTLTLVIYRGLVPFLWGGGSDLLLIAAIMIALISAPIILWLGTKAVKNILKS